VKHPDFRSISSILEGRGYVPDRLKAHQLAEQFALEHFFSVLEEEGFEDEDIQRLLCTEEGLDFLFNTEEGQALLEAGGALGFVGNLARGAGSAIGGLGHFAAKHPILTALATGHPGLAAGLGVLKAPGAIIRAAPGVIRTVGAVQDYRHGKLAAAHAAQTRPLELEKLKADLALVRKKACLAPPAAAAAPAAAPPAAASPAAAPAASPAAAAAKVAGPPAPPTIAGVKAVPKAAAGGTRVKVNLLSRTIAPPKSGGKFAARLANAKQAMQRVAGRVSPSKIGTALAGVFKRKTGTP